MKAPTPVKPPTSFTTRVAIKSRAFIRSFDAYGETISFTFHGSKSYPTFLGGLLTLLSRFLILGYLLTFIRGIINHESTITNTSSFISTADDNRTFLLNESNFDFAMELKNTNESYRVEEFDEYMNIRFFQTESYWEENEAISNFRELETEKCQIGRFQNDSSFRYQLENNANFLCPKNFSITVSRNYFSDQFRVIFATIEKCNQEFLDKKYPNENRKCKPGEEVDDFADSAFFFFVRLQQYVDTEEFQSNPIKPFLEQIFFQVKFKFIMNGFSTTMGFKIAQNIAFFQDSWFTSMRPYETYYYTSKIAFQNIAKPYNHRSFTIILFADENVQKLERVRNNLFDAFSATGGLIEIFAVCIQLLISSFQQFKFNSKVMQKLFMVDKHENVEEKGGKNPLGKNVSEQNLENNSSGNVNNEIKQVLRRIQNREKLKVSYFRYQLRSCQCISSKRLRRNFLLYNNGLQKIEQSLDLIHLVKKIRHIQLITSIMVSKYQKTLVPFFTSNILSEEEKQLEVKDMALSNEKLKQYLRQVILNSRQSKVDRKILKELNPAVKERKSSSLAQHVVNEQFNRQLNKEWNTQGYQEKIVDSWNIKSDHFQSQLDEDDSMNEQDEGKMSKFKGKN